MSFDGAGATPLSSFMSDGELAAWPNKKSLLSLEPTVGLSGSLLVLSLENHEAHDIKKEDKTARANILLNIDPPSQNKSRSGLYHTYKKIIKKLFAYFADESLPTLPTALALCPKSCSLPDWRPPTFGLLELPFTICGL